MAPLIFVCLLSLILSAVGVKLVLKYWRAPVGIDSGDRHRKSQPTPILRLGGVAVLLGFAVASLWANHLFESLQGIRVIAMLLLCGAMFAIGFADDVRSVPALWRLLAQIVIAVAAYHLGFRIETLDLPFAPRIDLDLMALPVTVLWLVALPNIFNLSDGMDGLAGGLGISVFAVIGSSALLVGNSGAAILAFVMVAAVAGFLYFNLPPARVYLGDGGAYLIGFYAALLTIESSQKGTAAIVLLIVMVVLAYPLADTTFAICRRLVYGFPIFRADAEHLHHRMITLGLSRGWLLGSLYTLFLCLAVGGVGMMLNRNLIIPVAIGAAGLLGLGAFYARAYCLHPSTFPDRVRRALKARRQVRYAIRLSQVLEHELDFTADGEDFWDRFLDSVRRAGLEPVGLTVTSPESTQPDQPRERQFDIGVGSLGRWTLIHRKDPALDEWNWHKVAQCFLPCLSAAIDRWPPPPSLGLTLSASTHSEKASTPLQSPLDSLASPRH